MEASDNENWIAVRCILEKSLNRDTLAYYQLMSIKNTDNIIAESCMKGYISLLSVFIRCEFPIQHNILCNIGLFYTKMLNLTVREGQLPLVEYLVSHGADVNAHDSQHITPLYCAAEKGHTEVTKFLLNAGADLNLFNKDNYSTALHISLLNSHTDEVKLLLAAGCDVNQKVMFNKSALHHALLGNNFYYVKLLIEFGANVNDSNILHQAVEECDLSIISLLLQYGAEINDKAHTPIGGAPLHSAVSRRSTKVVKYLLDLGANVNIKNNMHETPLFCVTDDLYPVYDIVQLLLNSGADINTCDLNGNTVLHRALHPYESQKQPLVELLLEHGANVNARRNDDITALQKYISVCHSIPNYLIPYELEPLSQDIVNVVGTLVIWGADVNVSDDRGHTLIHWAVWAGSIPLVKLLIECGLGANAKNQFGKEPIHLAAEAERHDMVQFFIDHNYDVRRRTESNVFL